MQFQRAEQLRQFTVEATNGEIGEIHDLYFDDSCWVVRYFIVNAQKWLSGRRVLITPRAVTGLDTAKRRLLVGITREQVEKSPAMDTKKPVSRQYEEAYYQYYGWKPYWETGLMPALGFAPTPAPLPQEPPPSGGGTGKQDPHLRSMAEVTAYYIKARDGEIGHVEDFIIVPGDWAIRYLEVDTRNWWPGKKVLVAPAWISSISWEDRQVFIDLPRKKIQFAPEYDPVREISRNYEIELFKHYSGKTE